MKWIKKLTINKDSEFLCGTKKRYEQTCKYCSHKVEQPAKEESVCDACYALLSVGGLR